MKWNICTSLSKPALCVFSLCHFVFQCAHMSFAVLLMICHLLQPYVRTFNISLPAAAFSHCPAAQI
jgi:hypothetical protein